MLNWLTLKLAAERLLKSWTKIVSSAKQHGLGEPGLWTRQLPWVFSISWLALYFINSSIMLSEPVWKNFKVKLLLHQCGKEPTFNITATKYSFEFNSYSNLICKKLFKSLYYVLHLQISFFRVVLMHSLILESE